MGRRPGAVYLAVNAVTAGAAFLLIDQFEWKFGFPAEGANVDALRVLVAGYGAMALFRSSLFLARIGGKDVGVVLNAADAEVDRETAKIRASTVEEIRRDVDPEKARTLLPLFCYRLLQSSLPEDEFIAIAINRKIEEAYRGGFHGAAGRNSNMAHTKAYIFGLIIMNYMGEEVLRAAVETLLSPEITLRPGLDGPYGASGMSADLERERHAGKPRTLADT